MTPLQRRFLEALRTQEVPHVVIGGYALRGLGMDRQTHDLDILVGQHLIDAHRLADALSIVGCPLAPGVSAEYLAQPKKQIILPTPQAKEIDVLTSVGDLSFADIYARRVVAIVGDVEFPHACAADLLQMIGAETARATFDIEAGRRAEAAAARLIKGQKDASWLSRFLQSGL